MESFKLYENGLVLQSFEMNSPVEALKLKIEIGDEAAKVLGARDDRKEQIHDINELISVCKEKQVNIGKKMKAIAERIRIAKETIDEDKIKQEKVYKILEPLWNNYNSIAYQKPFSDAEELEELKKINAYYADVRFENKYNNVMYELSGTEDYDSDTDC